jgi:hypothetical protein
MKNLRRAGRVGLKIQAEARDAEIEALKAQNKALEQRPGELDHLLKARQEKP